MKLVDSFIKLCKRLRSETPAANALVPASEEALREAQAPSDPVHRLQVIAWLLFLASLFLPAVKAGWFPPAGYIPVGVVAASSFGAFTELSHALTDPGVLMPVPTATAVFLFVCAPLLFAGGEKRRFIALRRVIAFGMLGSWFFPVMVGVIASPQQRHSWGVPRVEWGYYLFSVAHTMMFIAVELRLISGTRPSGPRGFPVVMKPDSRS